MRCKLKICGVTNREDAHNLVALGVDALGVNFWKESKRFIEPENAKPFLEEVKGQIIRVGVFVNEDISKVLQIYKAGMIDFVQLHGDEDDAYCQKLAEKNIDLIRVIRIAKNASDIEIPDHAPEHVLLDSLVSGYGGAGEKFSWNLAKKSIQQYPSKKVILAGGINAENILHAMHLKPFMLDVASGAESQPGVKDFKLIKEMLAILTGL